MKKNKNRLPDKPSDLIELALKDLALIEKNKKYNVDMWGWHEPDEDQRTCSVCFAGAVMASTLKSKRTEQLAPYMFANDISSKLSALNHFRSGLITRGLFDMALVKDIHAPSVMVEVTDYETDEDKFKADMRKIAKTFRKLGL